MTTYGISFLVRALLTASLLLAGLGAAWADGRAGAVEWSDGHKQSGQISLSPGKDLRLFTGASQVALKLDEVKEIRFKVEKEQMWEGFYFPNAGQATQAKTGEVYPIRYLLTDITLADGKVLEGHLFTTTVYVETDDGTEKVVLLAKQTGTNGQKLSDLLYPTAIRFEAGAESAGFSQIDLTQAGLEESKPPVIVALPDLSPLSVEPSASKTGWTVPFPNPGKILFSVEAKDGIHVAWPATTPDPAMLEAAETGLKAMQDFYDTRTILGCFTDADSGDIYTLVMMKRLGTTYGYTADKIPWGVAILRWKYDAGEKKATLLNRVPLAMGRLTPTSPLPAVLKQPELLKDVSAAK
jgi:hypothetical protein